MERTQKERVLEHLKNGNSLTPLEALNFFGSFRLGAIIFELRHEGNRIKTEFVKNGKKTFAKYTMEISSESNGQSSFTEIMKFKTMAQGMKRCSLNSAT
jgi:hypothetical protein